MLKKTRFLNESKIAAFVVAMLFVLTMSGCSSSENVNTNQLVIKNSNVTKKKVAKKLEYKLVLNVCKTSKNDIYKGMYITVLDNLGDKIGELPSCENHEVKYYSYDSQAGFYKIDYNGTVGFIANTGVLRKY